MVLQDSWESVLGQKSNALAEALFRKTEFLKHPIFNRNRSELEITRYIFNLAKKDLTLVDSMIPLGSLYNEIEFSERIRSSVMGFFKPITPLIPKDQAEGYSQLTQELSDWLAEITGFHSVSLQPNSGASGEYAGLVAIRSYHESRGDNQRNICLIPESAHGTNPASASLVGFKVISIACSDGCVDLEDLK